MFLARVSNIEAYRRWKNWRPLYEGDEEPTIEDFIQRLLSHEPSEAMLAGTAFHKVLELAQTGNYDSADANGYNFHFRDEMEIELPVLRELRGTATYGDLKVTGQVDGILNGCVVDYKTTKRFDAENYLNGCQWKFYLSIFKLDIFQWKIFEIKEIGEKEYSVQPPHNLSACRYPELEQDCIRLAEDYLEFARIHLPAEYGKSLAEELNIAMEAC